MSASSRTDWPRLGALPDAAGIRFALLAPAARRVELVLEHERGKGRPARPLAGTGDGLFTVFVDGLGAGARYRYAIDGQAPFPDPASRSQPDGVHGPSEVVDPGAYPWSDAGWRGVPLEALVLYELHVGAFTPEGTFRAAIARLPHLKSLGVTALELMPVHAFPGRRNWGYDPAALFAPACAYGAPDDLRALVDAAHALGLAVHLDVVYNHLGPDGAYTATVLPMLNRARRTAWGASLNVDGPGSPAVRELLLQNVAHWIGEYHLDGLRLDAIQAIPDDGPSPLVSALAARARAAAPDRPIVVVAEDPRNDARVVRPAEGGGLGCDAVWSFDFHHQAHRLLTGESRGHYADASDSVADLATIVARGWAMTGGWSHWLKRPRGTDPAGIPPQHFVFYLQNHDEIGNRSRAERLDRLTELAALRAATALLLLSPQTPLLFMGQEWAATARFPFFTDHPEPLGARVAGSRRAWLAALEADAFAEPHDPQDARTLEVARLDWDELAREPHAAMLRFHRRLLALRRALPAWRDGAPLRATAFEEGRAKGLVMERGEGAEALLVVVCLAGAGSLPIGTRDDDAVMLTSEDPPFTADPHPPEIDRKAGVVRFARPGAVVLRAVGASVTG